jgi:hypothetical protein
MYSKLVLNKLGYESPMSYLYFLGELTQSTFDLVQLLVHWKWIKNELGVNFY